MTNDQKALYASFAMAAGMTDVDAAFQLVYRLWDEKHDQTAFPQMFAARVYREAVESLSAN